jgi:hypothetical protein
LGFWGWGFGDWAQAPIPNPQSPIPNPQEKNIKISLKIIKKLIINKLNKYIFNI